MSDYPMLISNKLHSFRNFVLQAVEGIPRPQSKEMKTAAGSLRCPCP